MTVHLIAIAIKKGLNAIFLPIVSSNMGHTLYAMENIFRFIYKKRNI